MTRRLWLAAAVALSAATPAVCDVAPKDLAFVEGAIETPLTGTPGNPEEGIKVMTTNALGNCVACHPIAALPKVPFQGNIAPALDGAATRYSEAQLRGILVNAKMTFEASFMPPFYKTDGFIRPGAAYTGKAPEGDLPPILTAQQIEDVLSYLVTLK